MKAVDAHRLFGMPEYEAAVQGLIPPPSAERIAELDRVVNRSALMEATVKKIWEAPAFSRNNRPPEGWDCAWDHVWSCMILRYPKEAQYDPVKRKKFKDRMHLKFMSLATDIARTSPRAWGVLDPSKESYCSGCHSARPTEDFDEGYATCRACLNSKN